MKLLTWIPTFFILIPLLSAHEGPPYPICVDEEMGPITLSIWADPDVGEGTFYYYLDPPTDGVQVQAVAQFQGLPGGDPVDQVPIAEVRGTSHVPNEPSAYQQIGTLPFEHRGDWQVTFRVQGEERPLGEIRLDIDVTPPGLGTLYLLWYAIPFFAAAAIWLRMFLASRDHARNQESTLEGGGPFAQSSPSNFS
ncbi:MAG: hypothetical protein KDB61_11590 [Planctomycetes bacterium]|nr:hypothetical protein [Planctomycetota bacterium]